MPHTRHLSVTRGVNARAHIPPFRSEGRMARHPRLAVPVGPEDHVLGSANAPLTLVMYGDYTCPYTLRAWAFVDVARRKLGRKMRYAFRDFPREELHAEAGLL